MRFGLVLAFLVLALNVAAARPRSIPAHVPTGDYWGGYAGTKVVPAYQAARWLTWVETGDEGSQAIRRYGVRTLAYADPNRVQPGDPLYGDDDSMYAHTCDGRRARASAGYKGQLLTDPRSPTLAQAWRRLEHADAPASERAFSAIFVDDAGGAIYATDQPCNYNFNAWLAGEAALIKNLHLPVIYNGLNDFYDRGPAKEIALNAVSIGGMMEECYTQLNPDHRVAGWRWWATEQTELRMAQDRKWFICYGRDTTPADQAGDSRMYAYASYLLTYDPGTSVLWEYYKTPTGAHVMPETQLVALDPLKRVGRIADLRLNEGVYVREYRKCYIAGRFQGACAAAVNPDDDAHSLTIRGYRRTLQLRGSGTFDGGSIALSNDGPPARLESRAAVIVFK